MHCTQPENLVSTMSAYPVMFQLWKRRDFVTKVPWNKDYRLEKDKAKLRETLNSCVRLFLVPIGSVKVENVEEVGKKSTVSQDGDSLSRSFSQLDLRNREVLSRLSLEDDKSSSVHSKESQNLMKQRRISKSKTAFIPVTSSLIQLRKQITNVQQVNHHDTEKLEKPFEIAGPSIFG